MSDIERRHSGCELEIRSDGRTVAGLLVPFNTPTEIRSLAGTFIETIAPGSFTRTIAERGDRVKLLAEHRQDAFPVGKATLLREDARGLYGEFLMGSGGQAEEARSLIADGIVDAFSVGFRPIRDQWATDRRSVTRLEVALAHVGLTGRPAYDSARVEAIRTDDDDHLVLTRAACLGALREHHQVPTLSRADALARLRSLHETSNR